MPEVSPPLVIWKSLDYNLKLSILLDNTSRYKYRPISATVMAPVCQFTFCESLKNGILENKKQNFSIPWVVCYT